jgi:hypothetical protein
MDAEGRVRALHQPHSHGDRLCTTTCEAPHPGVQVCNADDYSWPCPTIRALDEPEPCTCGDPGDGIYWEHSRSCRAVS